MELAVITQDHPTRARKYHIARPEMVNDSLGPLCGGGRDGRKQISWQTDLGGIEIVNCIVCLRRAVKFLEVKEANFSERTCRKCNCTHTTPCMSSSGPCAWVEKDLCSACETPEEREARYKRIYGLGKPKRKRRSKKRSKAKA